MATNYSRTSDKGFSNKIEDTLYLRGREGGRGEGGREGGRGREGEGGMEGEGGREREGGREGGRGGEGGEREGGGGSTVTHSQRLYEQLITVSPGTDQVYLLLGKLIRLLLHKVEY